MQKWNEIIRYLLITVCGCAAFLCGVCRVRAEGSVGEFTHMHEDACYTAESYECSGSHPTVARCSDQTEKHCHECNARVMMNMEFDKKYCSEANAYWYDNGTTKCSVCGALHMAWGTSIPRHTLSRKRLTCGISEGERVVEVLITAPEGWTNAGVTLTASCNLLKGNAAYAANAYGWADGKLYVTENGTYSVEAVNAKGQRTTASYTVRCIDRTAPVIEAVEGQISTMSRTAITVSVRATDSESGLAAEAYSIDGGSTWTAQTSFTVQEGAPLELVVRDAAGNTVHRTIRRNEFPYPPEPTPTPPPAPTPTAAAPVQPTPASSGTGGGASNGTASDTGTKDGAGNGSTQNEATDSADSGNTRTGTKDGADGEHARAGTAAGSDSGSARTGTKDRADSGSTGTEKADKPGTESAGIREKAGADDGSVKAGIDGREFLVERMQRETEESSDDNTAAAGSGSLWKNTKGTQRISESGGEQDNAGNTAGAAHAGAAVRAAGEALPVAGMACILIAGGLFVRLSRLHSVVLYCYDGGEEYRKLGVLHLRKRQEEFELELPEEMLRMSGTPRYRILLQNRLVKHCAGMDLVLKSEDCRMRYPLEECVDFVL